MKKLVVAKKDVCMACKACEVACSEAFYKEFDEDKSCIRISVKKDGETPKPIIYAYSAAKCSGQAAITQNAKGVYLLIFVPDAANVWKPVHLA